MLLAMTPSWGDAPRGDGLLRTVALRMHNAERARAGVPPLEWNDELAAHAAAYARTLIETGRYEHDSTPGRRRAEGENLWKGQRGLFSYQVMLGQMTMEGRYFRPGRYPDVSATGSWHDLGHYTQMIWPTTTRVGCAVASGAGADALVCRYSPPGNKDGVYLAELQR